MDTEEDRSKFATMSPAEASDGNSLEVHHLSQPRGQITRQESISQVSDHQDENNIKQEDNLSHQQDISQIPDGGNVAHLARQQTLTELLPQTVASGGLLCSVEGISSQEILREISKQDQLHCLSAAQELSGHHSHDMRAMEDSQHAMDDIAAPEVRTRVRSQQEEIVLLQSTFTQTLPVPAEPKKASVAVQTHFRSDYETQAYSVITGDGSVSYDSDGVRVLRAIGNWSSNYQANEQFVDQNSEVYMNGSGSATVSSPENSMIQHSVSSSPNSASNCTSAQPNRSVTLDQSQQSQDQSTANKPLPPGDKSAFVCPVCSKGLARKDKLVIHMRIHTGEKPYVCEVCERAFARRDKLVMHMNKLKHLTPTNIAPLGKRHHSQTVPAMAVLAEKRQDMKLETQEMGSPASSVDIQPAALVQVIHEQPTMTWNCELCGQICMSREEWTTHARSHLDGESSFATTSVSTGLSVLTPLSSYQYVPAPPDRQICVVCRQEYSSKADLIIHLRSHFVGKPELLANHVASLADPSGIC